MNEQGTEAGLGGRVTCCNTVMLYHLGERADRREGGGAHSLQRCNATGRNLAFKLFSERE